MEIQNAKESNDRNKRNAANKAEEFQKNMENYKEIIGYWTAKVETLGDQKISRNLKVSDQN